MTELVLLLEEPSAKAMLEGLLPRIIPGELQVRYIVFEGKRDLDRNLRKRLQGYRNPHAMFVILRDKDSSDCHELESWFLADLAAVEKGLEMPGLAHHQNRAKFREPDSLVNAAEELEKLTQGVYQKISGSRAIGPLLEIDNNRSVSFRAFVAGIRRLLSQNNSLK